MRGEVTFWQEEEIKKSSPPKCQIECTMFSLRIIRGRSNYSKLLLQNYYLFSYQLIIGRGTVCNQFNMWRGKGENFYFLFLSQILWLKNNPCFVNWLNTEKSDVQKMDFLFSLNKFRNVLRGVLELPSHFIPHYFWLGCYRYRKT